MFACLAWLWQQQYAMTMCVLNVRYTLITIVSHGSLWNLVLPCYMQVQLSPIPDSTFPQTIIMIAMPELALEGKVHDVFITSTLEV